MRIFQIRLHSSLHKFPDLIWGEPFLSILETTALCFAEGKVDNPLLKECNAMKRYIRSIFIKTFTGFVMVVVFTLLATNANCAELLPFPSDEQKTQQSVPSYRMKFRRQIGQLTCPDLTTLRRQLIGKLQAARTTADIDYYSGLLVEINGQMSSKGCPIQ